MEKPNKNSYQEIFGQLNLELNQYPQRPKVIAVSKYVGSEEIKKAYDAGFRDFGENRVPDLITKAIDLKILCPEIRWHFIGNIQSNKIKELMSLENLFAIHSVDSLKHLKMIGERCIGPVKIFLQVNTSDESQKGGLNSTEDLAVLVSEIKHYPYLFFEGLMTMASMDGDLEKAKLCFNQLKDLAQAFPQAKLSMGMSGDYQIALEAGSHYIRVGSLIFK